ncbi:MAG: undecaprenyl-diphosphate phosphatase [Gemmatimonadales bacterium]|nr:MAG: undecaprenyl-diphosphate phosphatase [Gemmatimonadales bacterium]
MGLILLLQAALLGLVEGITEFIPVSSTGHLIVAGELLGFTGERAKTFEIFIQLGAILAVVWLYRDRFLSILRSLRTSAKSRVFVLNLALGFLPAAVIGLWAHRWIKAHLFTVPTVAGALVVGGIAILFIERTRPVQRVATVDELPPRLAFGVGVAQVLALFPGVSRAGATILGGYLLGLSRTAATEFSFFLAVPVMVAATLLDVVSSRSHLSAADIPMFTVGFVVSFLSALVVIRAFIGFVAKRDFTPFAWYRIVAGVALLVWWKAGGG